MTVEVLRWIEARRAAHRAHLDFQTRALEVTQELIEAPVTRVAVKALVDARASLEAAMLEESNAWCAAVAVGSFPDVALPLPHGGAATLTVLGGTATGPESPSPPRGVLRAVTSSEE